MTQPIEEVLDDLSRREQLAWRQAIGRSSAAIAAMSRSETGVERRFAAIAWSAIAEPGDIDAGELVEAIGTVAAARLVLCPEPLEGIRAALAGAGYVGSLLEEAGRLSRAIARWAPRARLDRLVDAAHAGLRTGTRILIPGDRDWPVGCDDLGPAAPHLLWVRSDRGPAVIGDATQRAVSLEALGATAIVGSRAATPYGEQVAIDLADGLARRGSAIVSGGAYGIDVAAHRAALANDAPTIAVLAGGADRLYPVGNSEVLRRIMTRGGAVVSELPCGQAPTRWRFLRRNRLIAAMAAATIVVEAGRRSGALNTAGHAAELGRPLGAVPGPITSAASSGCHRLVREYDAVLVTGIDDAVELVRGFGAAALVHPELDGFDAVHPDVRERATQGSATQGSAARDPAARRSAVQDSAAQDRRSSGAAGAGAPAPGTGASARSLPRVAVRDRLEGDRLRAWDALSDREGQTPGQVAARAGLAEAAARGVLASLELSGEVVERDGRWRRSTP